MAKPQPHVVLLGDSIFDNGAYTSGGPDVVSHLRRLVQPEWQVSLLAEDGATTADLTRQVRHVPIDASHLVISIGGNDALQNTDLLSLPTVSSTQALEAFATRLKVFEDAYRSAIIGVTALRRKTMVCTIYNGALEEYATAARVGLAIFNDVILRAAVDFRLDALELRSICTEPDDYANAIEPSNQGGLKIAGAVACVIGAIPASDRPASIWGRC
jgi:hypothetical protein